MCQVQMTLTLIPLQNEHVGMGICAKHTNFTLSWRYYSKSFIIYRLLAITIPVCQIQMILTLIPLQNEHDGMGMCTKHKIFFQSIHDSIFVVFGNNDCSVSNPNDFNTHTSSKWAWWDGDMRKTYKCYSVLKILLKNTIIGRFWL